MPESSNDSRQLLHDRSIRVRAYAREDDLIDLEAELVDVKGYDFPRRRGGVHKAGEPVHKMLLRITCDANYTIVAAAASFEAAPYGASCAAIDAQYADLVGMNLARGFRHSLKERFGGINGCTHMSELALVLPTAAIQAMAGRRRLKGEGQNPDVRPFSLDGCHALRNDGPIVREYMPRWYKVPKGAPPNDVAGTPEQPINTISSSSDS